MTKLEFFKLLDSMKDTTVIVYWVAPPYDRYGRHIIVKNSRGESRIVQTIQRRNKPLGDATTRADKLVVKYKRWLVEWEAQF